MFCKLALELSRGLGILAAEDIKRVHLGIVACYSYLTLPNRVVFYVQNINIRELYADRRVNTYDLHFDNEVAFNYIRINELKRAEELLENCLVCARSIKDDLYIGRTLHNYGRLYMQSEKWDQAIDSLEQAMECFEKGSTFYLRTLYFTIHCWIGKKKHTYARSLLKKSESLFLENEVFHIPYNALMDYITVRKGISLYDQPVEYIETVAIPHFEKTYDYHLATIHYQLLESYYKDKNNKKTLAATNAIRRIYERCYLNKEGDSI